MKSLLVCIFLLVSLAACAGASSSPQHNCSSGEEVCVEVRAEEPIFWSEPVTIVITVTSQKDISDLGVSLAHNVDVVVEGQRAWETNSRDITFFKGGTGWFTTIESNQKITFKRTVDLPPREGLFYIIVSANTPALHAVDEIDIYMTKEGGKVYMAGTSIPYTEGPMPTMNPDELATARALPTYTVYPTVTPVPVTEALPLEILGGTAYPGPGTPYP